MNSNLTNKAIMTTQLTIDPDQPYVFLAELPLKFSRIALIQSPDNHQMRSCGVVVFVLPI